MAKPRIANPIRNVDPAAGAGSSSPARLAVRLIVIALVVVIMRGGVGAGSPGIAQEASPMATPLASPVQATPEGASGPTTQVIVGEITIELTDDGIIPVHFESAVGRDVTITVVNAGDQPHTFTMDDFDIEIALEPGESMTVTLEQPELGTYPYSTESEDGEAFEGTMTIFI